MHDFVYHRPPTLDEACRLGAEEGAAFLAGGQTLLRDLKHRRRAPVSLVKISGVLSREIDFRDGEIMIGAGVTHAEVAISEVVRERLPALAGLAGHIGDPAVRHRATLGGAVAANEAAGDYPPACLALGATVHTTERDLAAAEFFSGPGRTVLEPGEIITAVTFPVPVKAAYVKFLNPAARYPMAGVFAALAADGRPRLAVTAARADGAFRWREAEAALAAAFVADVLRDVRLPPEGLAEDLFADAAYRGHLVGVLARRAVALSNAPGPGVAVFSHGSPLQSG
ncbi:FAD binding domain-containing protein [Desulfomonile tiedjei]|uniref:Aerobic-type carbon monoxide dehydrogenase, middle subunit CoxM/CutM-like protein n=1 Tax=Desulfomonile tiedjei (strain ATCC 49306 / DSM 6799 / DCB-1) TaxID=706587 RepID=I4CEK1_DESTA|nr:FAD binding domain-containing protein [Desulfomonile tiedjei]AFM27992.1 aerobic-type carbon monoxide dehydrogenase, middle subunit CoxM/CutM-like protein [Desulfomonile tiedjei DSM 6799]